MIKRRGSRFADKDADVSDAVASGDFDPGEEVPFELADFEVADYTVPDRNELLDKIEAFFAPDGPLKSTREFGGQPYEHRPQQLAMSRAIAQALGDGGNLCVEAPTGVGKSFAYLLPLIFRSRHGGRPALISTETINLQEQLIDKDIPLLKQLTGVELKAVLAKGRGNYLCLRRYGLQKSEIGSALLPAPSLELDLNRLRQWLSEPGCSGERGSARFKLAPELWQLVNSESGNCQGARCPHYGECFYYRARSEWEKADLVVANHALFFTDLRLRNSGDEDSALLPPYAVAVIDEAHTLEDNAAEYLGLHLSRAGVIAILNRLYNPDNAKGLLMTAGEKYLDLRQLAAEARDEAYGFFRAFDDFLTSRNTGCSRIFDTTPFPDHLSGKLAELGLKLDAILDSEPDNALKTEIESSRDRLTAVIDSVGEFLALAKPDSVYYVELERNNIVLRGAPLNVPELLKVFLFDTTTPVILSSATLQVAGSFDYYLRRIGFDNGVTLALDSPFDPGKVEFYLPRAMPPPQSPEYQPEFEEQLKFYLQKSRGRAFVLFTSYQALRRTAEDMREWFSEQGMQLIVQGENLTRNLMVEEFKRDVSSVLFGTDSFWTGVDVPGEALSCVVIAKLPFAAPNHPLIAARSERVEKAGGNSFGDYSLPEAVLKFRQGAGRLIRSQSDHGMIVLLDSRAVTKFYGKKFLDSLPYAPRIV